MFPIEPTDFQHEWNKGCPKIFTDYQRHIRYFNTRQKFFKHFENWPVRMQSNTERNTCNSCISISTQVLSSRRNIFNFLLFKTETSVYFYDGFICRNEIHYKLFFNITTEKVHKEICHAVVWGFAYHLEKCFSQATLAKSFFFFVELLLTKSSRKRWKSFYGRQNAFFLYCYSSLSSIL